MSISPIIKQDRMPTARATLLHRFTASPPIVEYEYNLLNRRTVSRTLTQFNPGVKRDSARTTSNTDDSWIRLLCPGLDSNLPAENQFYLFRAFRIFNPLTSSKAGFRRRPPPRICRPL